MQTFTSLIEEWRPIPGFPDYDVSNTGKVRSHDRYRRYRHGLRLIKGQELKPAKNPYRGNYPLVVLYNPPLKKRVQVHRLVAEAFIPNPENKPFINHIDCNTGNNCVWNLEWCTPQENVDWMIKCGRQNIATEKPLIATNLKTGERFFYKSSMDAARCGHSRPSIWRAITGEYKHHHGMTWKYANAE